MGTKTSKTILTFENAEALAAFRQVRRDSSGDLVYADAGELELGTTLDNEDGTSGRQVSVLPRNIGGSRMYTAAGAISDGAPFYNAADGKVSATANGKPRGIALQAASGDGHIFEGLPEPASLAGGASVQAHTADATLTAADAGTVHTNTGASGAVTLTLPSATNAGLEFTFLLGAAQDLRLDPAGSETISATTGVPGSAGKYLEADAVGESITIVADGVGNWFIKGYTGTWAHES